MPSAQYVIRGGREGRERLRTLADVLRPTTDRLLDRLDLCATARCLDVGCGGGDVTAMLAARAPDGRVVGTDIDAVKLEIARSELADHVELRHEDIATTVGGAERFDLVYCRFVLSHLGRPERWVPRLARLVADDGWLVLEDTDIAGGFCWPASAAFDRANEIYAALVRARGGEPDIGPSLPVHLRRAGLAGVGVEIVQPAAITGAAKHIQRLTLAAIRDQAVAAGMTDHAELDALLAELDDVIARPDTVLTTARVVQAWGRRATPWEGCPDSP